MFGGHFMRMLIRIVAVLIGIGLPALGQAQNADWPKSLTLGTASPGGVYYVYGEAVTQILTESLKITVNHLPTQGPVHNVKLVESGDAQLGMITMGVGLQGWNGTADWTGGQRYRKMRALFPMYDTTFQVRRVATIRNHDCRSARQEAHWGWTTRGNRRRLCSGNIEGSRNLGKDRQWIVCRRGI